MNESLKRIECEKKAFLDEQATKEERFRLLEAEQQALLELKRKSFQEEQDRLLAQQLNDQFNNRGINSGNNSPPSTPSGTPQSRRCSRTPSRSPSPRGRRTSQHRKQTPPRNSRQPSQRAHHGSQHVGSSASFDDQDFMRMQQEPLFQQYVEKYLDQNKDKFLESLINKGAKVLYKFDVDRKIKKQGPSQEEEIKQLKRMMEKVLAPKSSF